MGVYAQDYAAYNSRGDTAFQNNDFSTARSLYAEGLNSCNLYSIKKLAEIWEIDSLEQEGMQRSMRFSFNCLKTNAENGNQEAMPLLRDFYYKGIGTEIDSIAGAYWNREYGVSLGYIVDSNADLDNPPVIIGPKKSLLSNLFHSFLCYTYSPTMLAGFMAGIYYDKFGFYVSGRTSTISVSAVYECNNEKVPAIEEESPKYQFNRKQWHSRLITGGVLYPLLKNRFFITAGGGYGERKYYREIITDKEFATGNKSEWCYNTEASYKSVTIEAGAVYVLKKLTLAGGINSTALKDFDIYLSLGLSF